MRVLMSWLAPGVVCCCLFIAGVAWPCTTVHLQIRGKPVVAKSYDWHTGTAAVMINKRGQSKKAFVGHLADTPAEWESKYASLTFNQYGREMPCGGMNEAGLVVEVMWFELSEYPLPDERPTVGELQWIQWALDSHATVAQLVEAAPGMRVSPLVATVHYMACDAGGDCAAMEYVDGELVISHGAGMPAHVLTNNSYESSWAYAQRFDGFGGILEPASGTGSKDRFVRAGIAASTAAAPGPHEQTAFSVLDDVSMGPYSKWNIVYRPDQLQVMYRTADNRAIRVVDLGRFDGSCGEPVMVLGIDEGLAGDVTDDFQPYTRKANRTLIVETLKEFEGVFFGAMVRALVLYPETAACTP